MECFSGSFESEEFVVVTDEDLLEMFQSPDSWLPWEASKSESFNSNMTLNQTDDGNENYNQQLIFEDEKGQFSFRKSEQSISSTVTGGLFLNPYNDHAANLWDMIETEYSNDASNHTSFEPQFSLNFNLLSSISNDRSANVEYNPAGMVMQYGVSSGDYYENNASSCCGGEMLLEEGVLNELGMAMIQLPESTRLCFRDCFYRLSYKSIQQGQMQASDNERIRSSSEEKGTAESGADFIDRVVASFMCGK